MKESDRNTSRLHFVIETAKEFGLDPDAFLVLAMPIAGTREDVATLADQLLARLLRDRETQKQQGGLAPVRIGGMIPPQFVSYVAAALVDACRQMQMPPPEGLCRLLSIHLNAQAYGNNNLKDIGAYQRAVWVVAAEPKASFDAIANYAGVSKGTISKWRKESSFALDVEAFRADPGFGLHQKLILHQLNSLADVSREIV